MKYQSQIKTSESKKAMTKSLNSLSDICHGLATEAGWWHNPETGEKIQRNKGEMLCLIHSEISEAMEGARKNIMDDHLPDRKMEEVELADALIRIFDYAGAHDFDLGGAVVEKLIYNTTRKDHSKEARLKGNGKKF